MTKKYKCRVEYLEATGTQYIDTGVVGNGEFDVDYLYYQTEDSTNAIFAGTRSSTQHLNFGQRSNGSGGGFSMAYLGEYWQAIATPAINTKIRVQISYKSGSQTGYLNGTAMTGKTLTGTEATELSIYIFKRNHYGTDNVSGLVGRIYYFKLWKDGVLVRDYIPVLDNNNRPALYDQVSDTLFYNQGSGEFTYGRQIIPVEYLESTGTQWIDTGSNVNTSTDEVEVLFQITDTNKYKWIFGEYDTNARIGVGSGDGNNLRNFLYKQSVVKVNDTEVYGGQHKFLINTSGAFLNGVKKADYSSFLSTSTVYLFNLNIDSSSDYKCSGKIWSYRQKRNGVLIVDLIPAIDENNTPFMFDKVHNTVYLNAGTGQFKVGPNVEKIDGKKMLRKKLALMLANLKKKRPYYCEVEYLQPQTLTSSEQYTTRIDTGISPTANTEVIAEIEPLDYNAGDQTIGARTGTTNNNRFFVYSMTYNGRVVLGGNSKENLYLTGTRFKIKFNETNTHNVYVNDTLVTTFNDSLYTKANDNHLLLFATTGYEPAYGTSNTRIYMCQIREQGVLVRDFIPVLDWNYTPCMYDRVTGQLFYNSGTGDFIAGREIHYVDYLESDGTQYIDTGIKPNNNTSVEIDYQLTQATQTRAGLFGALNMSGSNQGRVGSILSPTNSYLEHGYGSGNNYWQQGMPDTNRHLLFQKKNEVYFDGTLIHTFNTATFSLAINAYLGNFFYTNYTPAKAKYYSSRWWDGNDLVRDYKPAIDENGVCFWFDRISHTIYDNAGTGVFSYPARETEYTGNDGTAAYIDLGAKYKPSMSIEGKYTRDNYGTNGSVMLLTTTTTAPLIYLPALSGYTAERYVWRRPPYTEQSYFISTITYPFTCEMKVDAVNDTLTLNGNVVKTGMIAGMNGYNSPYQSYSNMYMFSITGSYAGDGKVYYLKITDGTTPLFDLMPAYKDGDAGFYNKVTGVFFKNASTNSSTYLVAGKIVEPEYE